MSDSVKGLRRGLAHYGDAGFSLFLRKAFIKAMGYSDDALDRTIVGITNTFSGYNACHKNVPDMIEAIKRGVMLAGGLPIEFPVISIAESFSHPTSMYLRNLMAIEVEEMVRAQPMDAVVLIGGCDKTVPALLMGAASADVPAILTVTGPMITGSHRGERLGACTDCRRLWGRHRAGDVGEDEIEAISGRLAPGPGTCMVMGTASTMALAAETLGMMLPGGAAIPAVSADRLRHAEATGARAVALAREDLRPSALITRRSLDNALRVLQAIGGSTNGLIHLAAIAGRVGVDLDYAAFDRMGAETPVLVDLKPSGQHYMEDLHKAGGLAPVLRAIADQLDLDCPTVTGRSLGEDLAAAEIPWAQEVVRPASDPIHRGGGLRVLRGNLAPAGALIKQSAATPALLTHTGRAVVFTSLEDLAERVDDPGLEVEAEDVLVLQNAGPKGAPGMPEAGYLPIPRKLLAKGVKDMVRLSDARMSGTAFGTIVLHVSPEAATGGPLALVRTGDRIRLDVPAGRIDVLVDEAELAARRAAWVAPPPHPGTERGYARLYQEQITQAEEGCDFAFLRKGGAGRVIAG
jgi:dihydroxy-acid dehydratase